MKTFKIVTFQLFNKMGAYINIPFLDSLIINNENDKNTWLLEIFFEEAYVTPFEEFAPGEAINVEVIITNKQNAPAVLTMKMISLKKIDTYFSVLLEGSLHHGKHDYAERLLESLIEKGLSGEALLEAFQQKIKSN
ncbi:YwpF-like family protein [Caldibacillus lycopersici]|uniref:YwpF-like family protein n=1 Tax=Perspicuibacillus lycopersici TaxID=1325689 RepID=A0AAE3LSY7_9BACI|nr:YwpF-like family protein [Perspicuibacillus lycopersici]MCU9613273.1 YwpF-like family protein [Perspicuibacillus lycopersici]